MARVETGYSCGQHSDLGPKDTPCPVCKRPRTNMATKTLTTHAPHTTVSEDGKTQTTIMGDSKEVVFDKPAFIDEWTG